MSFWNTQDEKRRRSLREVPTAALRRAVARAEVRLGELAVPGVSEALEAWLRAVEVVTRGLLRLERVLVRAERHNARVAAKREALAEGGLRERLGGEAALRRWSAQADVVANMVAEDPARVGAPPESFAGSRGMELHGMELRGIGAVRGLGEPEAGGQLYRGEASFRLARLPRPFCQPRLARPPDRAARMRTEGERRRRGRRNWMAGIPVWPCELGAAQRQEQRRRAGPSRRARDGRGYAGAPSQDVSGQNVDRSRHHSSSGRPGAALYAVHGRDP